MDTRLPEAPDQAPPVAATRPQAIALIRATARTCRGRIGSMHAKRDDAPEDHAAREQGLRSQIVAALHAGDVDTAKAIDTDTRRPCGYDFNRTIVDGPWDGQDHAYACPQCGVTGTYRAPAFPELVG